VTPAKAKSEEAYPAPRHRRRGLHPKLRPGRRHGGGGATLEHGLLHIDLARPEPEKRVQNIPIRTTG
jgi:HSP20 family molecular chaperone IbpA